MYERVKKAADYIKSICGEAEIALVLGSGLADSVKLENEKTIFYSDIPDFPVSTTESQKSEWVSGMLYGKKIIIMKGRFHCYEGYSREDIALPFRVMKLLGVKTVIITNASGGINLDYNPGDLMLIKDHINFIGCNPLWGKNDDRFGPRFPDMTNAYDRDLRELVKDVAKELDIKLWEGVYGGMPGPSFETPAEIRMLRIVGADAVGMSSIPDVIAANHCGIKVIGISLVSNAAAGITGKALSHEEVIAAGKNGVSKFKALVEKTVERL